VQANNEKKDLKINKLIIV